MRSFPLLVTLAVAALGLSAACTDLGVGQHCINPIVDDGGVQHVQGVEIVSPALECTQRLCFLADTGKLTNTGGEIVRGVCTAFCASDDDCANATTGDNSSGQCPSSFVCAVATVAGPFCCKKICVCKDDLVPNLNQDPVDGGVITPPACTASNSTCPNH